MKYQDYVNFLNTAVTLFDISCLAV